MSRSRGSMGAYAEGGGHDMDESPQALDQWNTMASTLGPWNGWQKPGISSDFNREQMQSLVIFWLKK